MHRPTTSHAIPSGNSVLAGGEQLHQQSGGQLFNDSRTFEQTAEVQDILMSLRRNNSCLGALGRSGR